MEMDDDDDVYNIEKYTDEELIHLLDIQPNSSDREIEAKILLNINKFKHMETPDSEKILLFFENVYSRLFEIEPPIYENDIQEDHSIQNETIKEGMVTMTTADMKSVDTDLSKPIEPKSAEPKTDKIANTNILSYNFDNQNPLLKQTIKRIITIDSQYRDNKEDIPTDFTFSLSDPLRNVVSLKLYSIHIPYTWYTINNTYGSNFFYINGNVDGINTDDFKYKIEVPSGNYTNTSIIDAVNTNISVLKKTYTDISFGTTNISYNVNTGIAKLNIDIKDQYNETSYYLQFNTKNWVTPTANNIERKKSIPSFLGFDVSSNYPYNHYYPYKIKSEFFNKQTDKSFKNDRIYNITSDNNHFTVYKYIGPNDFVLNTSMVDLSFIIQLSISGRCTKYEIYTDLSNQLANTMFLDQANSYVRLMENPDTNSFYPSKNFYELSLKYNRKTTQNLPYSKMAIVFPNENQIWTGTTSILQFITNTDKTMELNNIISDTTALSETPQKYIIQSTPSIELKCIKPGFNVADNDFTIAIPNTTFDITIAEYIDKLNVDITNANTTNEFFIPNTNTFIDVNNTFNMSIEINKNIDKSNFVVDFSGTVFKEVMNFDPSYSLFNNSGSIVSTFNYSSNFPINSKFAKFYPTSQTTKVTNDLFYSIINTDLINVQYDNLQTTILDIFKNYSDLNGNYIFDKTDFTLSLNTDTNEITATLNIQINIPITQDDYSIQFLDLNNITQSNFYIPANTNSFFTVLGYDDDIPYYLNQDFNVFTFATSIVTSYDFTGKNGFAILLNRPSITDALYPNSLYDYIIIKPTGTYTSTNNTKTSIITNLNKLLDDINTQLSLHPDLNGSLIEFQYDNEVDDLLYTGLTIILTIVINQKYYLNTNTPNSTWYNNLNIHPSMITQPYTLKNDGLYSKDYDSYIIVNGYKQIDFNFIQLDTNNNTFYMVPYETGVYQSPTFTITIPIGTYNLSKLLSTINTQFNGIPELNYSTVINDNGTIKFKMFVNKTYTAKDYNILFYNIEDFIIINQNINTNVDNTTWDTTLGWILGFRDKIKYSYNDVPLSNDFTIDGNNIVTIKSNTCVETTSLNYFFISLDDFNLNRLNDGLVTITTNNKTLSLPAYANTTQFIKDPITGNRTYNTLATNGYNKLTDKQIYAITEIANSTNNINNPYTANPYIQDTFGIIPLKLGGITTGSIYSEFGGSLQNQERTYFGPVNISKMKVRLLTDKGKIVDLNNGNWTFSLLCEQIYKKEPSKI